MTAIVLITLIVIASLLLIGIAVFSYVFFRSFLKREKAQSNIDSVYEKLSEPWKTQYKPVYEHIKAEQAWFLSLPYETLSLTNDGYLLYGYYLSQKSKKTVVIMHGYKQDACSEFVEARLYYDMGFNVFIPDIRSHGKSQGKYIGMGNVDRGDIIQWLELLQNKEKNSCKFLLVGFSMGAATVLTLSGNTDLPESVAAIISHSSFTSLKELLPAVVKINPPIIKRMLLWGFEIWCRILAKYGFNENTPEQGVQKSKTPIMIIHGVKDNFVPFPMSEKLFSLCASEKVFWADKNAGHDMIGWHEKAIYQNQIKKFLAKYFRN